MPPLAKTRPLPDIDLARITTEPLFRQRALLEQMRDGHPPISYAPVRSGIHDILNVQPEMFGQVSPTAWATVQALIKKKSRSEEEEISNLRVALGLHRFATETQIFGRELSFPPLAMGMGRGVVYWDKMVLYLNGRPLIPFFDPRRTRGMTSNARRFAFSMMHERIREADPYYNGVTFGIFQFGDVRGDCRKVTLHTDEEAKRYTLDQMEEMVNATYQLWREVLTAREEEAHRAASGLRGSLL